MIQHQFENQWGRLCANGLHILIGTGLQGKPLKTRIYHAFSQVIFLEPVLTSERSIALLATVNELAGRVPGEGSRFVAGERSDEFSMVEEGALSEKIDGLSDSQVSLLARYLCDFFMEAYAEERTSSKRPGGDDVVASDI